jgi:hypothetical protein
MVLWGFLLFSCDLPVAVREAGGHDIDQPRLTCFARCRMRQRIAAAVAGLERDLALTLTLAGAPDAATCIRIRPAAIAYLVEVSVFATPSAWR